VNKCHWCERPTDNPLEEVINGYKEKVMVTFCDACIKANEEFQSYSIYWEDERDR
jgi:hypothetical protein